jgi:hypothetical protein
MRQTFRRTMATAIATAVAATLGMVAAGGSIGSASPVPGTGGPSNNPGQGKQIGRRADEGAASRRDVSAPLRDLPAAPVGRSHEHRDSPMPTPAGPLLADPVVQQTTLGTQAPATASSFPGVGASGSAPSDANGAVGPAYYFDLVNARFQIFAKTGASVLGPLTTNTLWSGFGGECESEDHGDGTVRYDALADRWVVAQFALGPSGRGPFFQCLAVSATSDPTGRYYRYAFGFSSFPDYPKLAVWPDGYYETMNMFNSSGAFTGAETCAYERAKMLNGDLASMQCLNIPTTFGAILPADLDGIAPPPAGAPNMEIGLGLDNTHLASFRFQVDWSPGHAGTSLTETELAVSAYQGACSGGGTCIPQLGTTQLLDSLADRVMYRYAYRNFADHESWMVNYSVTAATVSAPRWFELRRTPASVSGPLTVFQDSTFSPDENHRWMGSIAMDASGDMALGYSKSSATMKPAIAYTGRLVTDPLNTMEPETVVLAGAGAQTTGLNRWGDYTAMDIDASDGCTFWYTNQYLPFDGTFNWATQIASFVFPSCTPRTDSDFSVAAFPLSGVGATGGSVTSSVSTGRTAGTAMAITLSASGLPTGVSASFAPPTVIAGPGIGSSSTLTLSVAPGTVPGVYPVTVNASGTGTALTHSTTFTLTVPGTTITNGGFETGDLRGWANGVGTAAVAAGGHSGIFAASVGTTTSPNGDSSISQVFTLLQPSTLSFWYQVNCTDTVAFDWATATLTDMTTGVTTTVLPKNCTRSGPWTQTSTALAASSVGHTFMLTLTDHDDVNPADPTVTKFDDVVLTPAAQPDFAVAATPPSQTVIVGGAAAYQATVTPLNGFTGSVAFAVTGLPPGSSVSFTPSTLPGSGTSAVSITTATTTPTGTFPLTITASSGALVHSTGVSLTVNPKPDFSVTVTPASQSVVVGGSTSFQTGVAAVNGFTAAVALAVTGLPVGATATFTPASIAGSGISTLSVTTAATTPTGAFPLTVTATSGSLTHSVNVTLNVSAAPDFLLSVSPANQSVKRNNTANYTVTIAPTGGFTSAVTLSVNSSPAGPTGRFTPASLTSGSSVLSVAGGAKIGTFTLVVTATGGGLTHSTTVVLNVTK